MLRYSCAIFLVGLAALLRLSLDSFLGQEVLPYSFFYIAVAVTAWWAGFRPALLASFLGLIVGIWLIVPPRHSLVLRGLPDFIEIAVYLFVTCIVTGLMTSLRKAHAAAQANFAMAMEKQRALESEVKQRMETEAALRRSEALLEQRVKERTAQLQELVDELRQFSYAIVHDMHAPLRSMRGFAEIIEEESAPALPAPSRDYLRRIQGACDRMDRLLRGALDYNKALLKRLPLQPVDLSKLLRELCATYSNLRPHQANIHLEGPLPSVLGNEAALTQCFSVLLGNAVKFVAPGVEPRIRVWAERSDHLVAISVRDNGIGIRASTQKHLFGIFQRHDSDHEGVGMGLAIVRKLVQRMGGNVGVESEEGKGSRFWIELKVAPADAGSPRSLEAANAQHPKRHAPPLTQSSSSGLNRVGALALANF